GRPAVRVAGSIVRALAPGVAACARARRVGAFAVAAPAHVRALRVGGARTVHGAGLVAAVVVMCGAVGARAFRVRALRTGALEPRALCRRPLRSRTLGARTIRMRAFRSRTLGARTLRMWTLRSRALEARALGELAGRAAPLAPRRGPI